MASGSRTTFAGSCETPPGTRRPPGRRTGRPVRVVPSGRRRLSACSAAFQPLVDLGRRPGLLPLLVRRRSASSSAADRRSVEASACVVSATKSPSRADAAGAADSGRRICSRSVGDAPPTPRLGRPRAHLCRGRRAPRAPSTGSTGASARAAGPGDVRPRAGGRPGGRRRPPQVSARRPARPAPGSAPSGSMPRARASSTRLRRTRRLGLRARPARPLGPRPARGVRLGLCSASTARRPSRSTQPRHGVPLDAEVGRDDLGECARRPADRDVEVLGPSAHWRPARARFVRRGPVVVRPGSAARSARRPAGSSGLVVQRRTCRPAAAGRCGPGRAVWPGRRRGRPVTAAMASSMRSR